MIGRVFSDNKVRESIEYLAKHLSEYKLRRAGKNAVRIGDVVIENCNQYFCVTTDLERTNVLIIENS